MKKKKETFFLNLQHLTEKVGIENVAVITLTVGDKKLVRGKMVDVTRRAFSDPVKFQEVMRSFRCHVLVKHFRGGWIIREMHEKGFVLHVHIVVATAADVRTGFDFASYLKARRSWQAWVKSGKTKVAALAAHKRHTAAYGKSASPELKRLWRLLGNQKTAGEGRKYGFGRIEVIPVRKSNPACIARYLGGYIGKDFGKALTKERKTRDVSFFGERNLRGVWMARSRHSVGGWVLRQKIRVFATMNHCETAAALRNKFGSHWFYQNANAIKGIDLKDYEVLLTYPTFSHYERVHGCQGNGFDDVRGGVAFECVLNDEKRELREYFAAQATPSPVITDDPQWQEGQNYGNKLWSIIEKHKNGKKKMNADIYEHEGSDAFLHELAREDCPYKQWTPQRVAWQVGYDCSKSLYDFINKEVVNEENSKKSSV